MIKTCAICKLNFETKYQCQNICSWVCRQEAQRERSKISMRRRRHLKRSTFPPCEVCQYKIITEFHHDQKSTHYLCPTHHALITRNYTTLQEMLSNPSIW